MPPSDFLGHLRRALNFRRADEADIWTNFTVVRPYDSRGLTVVRSQCNEQEIVVGNVSGLTFAPGSSVMIGTNTNRPGKAIIAGAPPGRMGASRVPAEISRTTYGTAPVVPATCPVSRTGRTYLGIYDDSAAETLYAFNYTDGEYQGLAGSISYAAAGLALEVNPHFQRAHTAGDTVVFFSSAGAGWQVCTWDVDAATLAVLEVDPAAFAGPIVAGSDIYFSSWDAPFLKLYRVDLGASGTWNEPAALVGVAYEDLTGLLFVPDNLSHSGGVNFDAPAFWFATSTEVRVPYFSGGAWNLGAGRAVVAGVDDPGTGDDGYAVTGGRSLRVTYLPGGAPALGLLPAGPGTPETSLLPADWSVDTLFNLSISPSKAEFCVFLGTSGETDQIVRLGIGDSFELEGCPVPGITVEPAASPAVVPPFMLCRDN